MREFLHKLKLFHQAYKQPYHSYPTNAPKLLCVLRHKLMKEENDEYLDAVMKNDMVEVADALGDQLYILCGTIITHGMQDIITDVFNEIHRSNMSKLGEDGKPITREDGKVMKGPNYSPPDLIPLIRKGYKYIGCANAWGVHGTPEPKDYTRCREAHHQTVTSEGYYKSVYRVHCDICRIQYEYDTSD